MLELTDAITNEVLEPFTFVLAYPTVHHLPSVSRGNILHLIPAYSPFSSDSQSIQTVIFVTMECKFYTTCTGVIGLQLTGCRRELAVLS